MTGEAIIEKILESKQNGLTRTPRIAQMSGYFLHGTEIYTYTVNESKHDFALMGDLNESEDNEPNNPFEKLVNYTGINDLLILSCKLLSIGTESIPADNDVPLQKVTQANVDGLIEFVPESMRSIYTAYEKPEDVFHALAMTSILRLNEFAENTRILRKNLQEPTLLDNSIYTTAEFEMLSTFNHKIDNVYSLMDIGLRIFRLHGKKTLAHQKFISCLESMSAYSRGIISVLNREDLTIYNIPVSKMVEQIISPYPEEDIKSLINVNLDFGDDSSKNFNLYNLIFNLTSNAWKYSAHPKTLELIKKQREELGLIELIDKESVAPVLVEITEDENYLTINISDSGLDISDKHWTELMSGKSAQKEVEGVGSSGRGFPAIVNSISELNGTIEMIRGNEKGYTKTIRVRIPI